MQGKGELAQQDSDNVNIVGGRIYPANEVSITDDSDTINISQSSDSNRMKRITWANVKSVLKTWIESTVFSSFSTQYIDFDLSPTALSQEGRMMWDADEGVPATGLAGGTVRLQHGLELLKRVRNASGVAMTDGQLVYIDGATGARPLAYLALALSTTPEKWYVCGMVTEPIDVNQQGYICVIGAVSDVNTSAYVEGTQLYLSPTTPGTFTDTAPEAPDAIIPVGVVLRQHATEGVILFFPQQARRFVDLADVNGTPLTVSGQIAEWDNINQYFDFSKNINDYELIANLGTIAYQDDDSVDINGGAIDGTVIGGTVRASGEFTVGVFGDGTNETEFEADGTIVSKGTATCWRDELNDLVEAASNNPASHLVYDFVEGALIFETTADINDYAIMNVQINHDWKAGSDVEPHIHWWQTENNTPNWLIQYRWQINGAAKTTTWTSVHWDHNAFTYVSGTLDQITSFGLITPPTGYTTSDILQLRFIRDVGNDSGLFTGTDPYTADVSAVSSDVHIEVDMFGSRERYIK